MYHRGAVLCLDFRKTGILRRVIEWEGHCVLDSGQYAITGFVHGVNGMPHATERKKGS